MLSRPPNLARLCHQTRRLEREIVPFCVNHILCLKCLSVVFNCVKRCLVRHAAGDHVTGRDEKIVSHLEFKYKFLQIFGSSKLAIGFHQLILVEDNIAITAKKLNTFTKTINYADQRNQLINITWLGRNTPYLVGARHHTVQYNPMLHIAKDKTYSMYTLNHCNIGKIHHVMMGLDSTWSWHGIAFRVTVPLWGDLICYLMNKPLNKHVFEYIYMK